MNITHAVNEVIKGDKLEAIFNRQKELMEKYHHIEARSGLLQTEDCPVNLDDKRGQARLKDFAWRTTEEIAEALETIPTLELLFDQKYNFNIYDYENVADAIEELKSIEDQSESHRLHFQEELIDALHFFTEFSILAGITPEVIREALAIEPNTDILDHIYAKQLINVNSPLDSALLNFITRLGLCCNCLKNKPWKQTQMITDKENFKTNVIMAWEAYIVALMVAGLNPENIANLYLKKSQVNQFRQRSKY